MTPLEKLLRRQPMTAKQIAKALGVSIPTAYAAIRRLPTVQTETVRESTRRLVKDKHSGTERRAQRPGPSSTVFSIK